MKYLVSLAVLLCFFRFIALTQTYQTLRGDEKPTPSTTSKERTSSWSSEATFITPETTRRPIVEEHNEDGNETNKNQRKFKKSAVITPGNESVEISALGFPGTRNSSELNFNEFAENKTSEGSKIKSIPVGENDIGDSDIKHDDKTRLETQIQSTTLNRFKGWSEGKGDIHMTASQSADRRSPDSIPGDVSWEAADYVASTRIKDIQKQDALNESKKHPQEPATHIWSSTTKSEEILTAPPQSNREMSGRFSAKTRGGTGAGREGGGERLNDSDIAMRDDKGNWFSLISTTSVYESTTPTSIFKISKSSNSDTTATTTATRMFQSISEDLINNVTTWTRSMQALAQVKEKSNASGISLTSSPPGSSKGRASSETSWRITESGITTPRILNESAFTNKEDFTALKGFTPSLVELYERTTLSSVPQVVLEEISWPVKREAVVEGDVILGGLMMVHEREDSITCGPVMPQGGVQALEAMLYTVDAINFRLKPRLLPGFTLGAHVLDDCDKDTYGLEMAVDFIKDSV